jgi:hypothetical protein
MVMAVGEAAADERAGAQLFTGSIRDVYWAHKRRYQTVWNMDFGREI